MECNRDRGRREPCDPRRIVYDWDHTAMPILISGGPAPAEIKENNTDTKAHILPARKRKAPPNPPAWTWGLIPISLDVDPRDNTIHTRHTNAISEHPVVWEANTTTSSKPSSEVEVTFHSPKRTIKLEKKDERLSQDELKTPGPLLRNPFFQECATEESSSSSSWNNRGLGVLVPNPFYKPPTIALKPDHEVFEEGDTDDQVPTVN